MPDMVRARGPRHRGTLVKRVIFINQRSRAGTAIWHEIMRRARLDRGGRGQLSEWLSARLALLAEQLGLGLALSHGKRRGGRAAFLRLVLVRLRLLLFLVASHLTFGHDCPPDDDRRLARIQQKPPIAAAFVIVPGPVRITRSTPIARHSVVPGRI